MYLCTPGTTPIHNMLSYVGVRRTAAQFISNKQAYWLNTDIQTLSVLYQYRNSVCGTMRR